MRYKLFWLFAGILSLAVWEWRRFGRSLERALHIP